MAYLQIILDISDENRVSSNPELETDLCALPKSGKFDQAYASHNPELARQLQVVQPLYNAGFIKDCGLISR
ncbi:hypothetical protein ABU178_16220 [Pantoea osteomyelitidis]|uniref:Uncharacterized protein n=1 Tax=Pantoea osteomyelitidis TaxID=3230026 RepID=A0ABW7PZH6_9GAMM